MQVYNEKLYIYGGVGADGLRKAIWVFCLKRQNWSQLKAKEEVPDNARTGHSMILWRSQLVVFGGSSHFNQKLKSREVFSTLLFYQLGAQTWSLVFANGEQVEPRRQHKAVVWNNRYMVVAGGIGLQERMLKETLMFNLENLRWIILGEEKELEEEVAYHTMCVGMNPEHNKGTTNYQAETVYLFGGKNDRSQANNDLYKLMFEMNNVIPLGWQKVATSGKAPEKCYSHSMDYLQSACSLVTVGGRSDSKGVLNQVFLFAIQHSVWQEVRMVGPSLERCCHASTSHHSRILLFGGISHVTYVQSHLYSIETGKRVSSQRT